MPPNNRTRKQPLDYRAREVGLIMERWRASESCSLVGVGSVGKSNLMQHLANPTVQAAYMKEVNIDKFKAIIIDPSMLGPLPMEGKDHEQIRVWAGFELMLHRLFLAFHRSDVLDETETRRFAEIYRALQDGSNPLYAYMGLRYFELALEMLLQHGVQIVFMFDEFEVMLKNLPIKFFLALRGLRDSNKKLLSYLTFTRSPLPNVLEKENINFLDIEQFVELFNDHRYFIGPFNEKDGRSMVEELMRRNQKRYDDYAITFLMWATGRFAGLMRAGYSVLDTLRSLDSSTIMTRSAQLASEMAHKHPVRVECRTIWNSLSDPEKYVLKAAAGLATFQRNSHVEEAVDMLVQKSLLKVDGGDGNLIIDPPVFHFFVANDEDATLPE